MQFLDLTLPTAAENLALDHALLEQAERAQGPGEQLRIWEPDSPFVVVGRSSRVATEVNLEACRRDQIPVLRRGSGGAAVVAGPGCLMYAVVLSCRRRPELRMVDQAHRFVLGVLADALRSLDADLEISGISDLTRHGRKFSGNSLRCKRNHVLYHGTILYDFSLPSIGRYLKTPPRQPDYRRQRPHDAFVGNFPANQEALRHVIRQAWQADQATRQWTRKEVAELVASRYSAETWNYRL